jgi:DNA-binding NtrC family response regulator
MKHSILIVDDEPDMLRLLKRTLGADLNTKVETVESGERALLLLKKNSFDLVLADIKMPGMDGLELLDLIKRDAPDQTVVMMTAHARIDMAVIAIKNGAYDFITKPFDHDELVMRLEKALERSHLIKENLRLLQACQSQHLFQELVGKSAAMQRVYESIRMVAGTDLTVLITGESGSGKDLVARAIHALSKRKDQAYVAVNCPTVPEQILESELFGYKKGAFTHATQNRIGLFQEAHKGTLFMDEIGDISPVIQTKLLRVLQDKVIKPLGDTKSFEVDVRIISSTNQDLKAKISQGVFREDFFYRLNVLPIKVPPLRKHHEDIPLIANHLIAKHCLKLDKPLKKLSHDLTADFMTRRWEGNVREMENLIIRGILFSTDDEIRTVDVGGEKANPPPCEEENNFTDIPYKKAKELVLKRFNSAYIHQKLAACNGNVTHAAKQCGLERQALQQIMRRYEIKADAFRG